MSEIIKKKKKERCKSSFYTVFFSSSAQKPNSISINGRDLITSHMRNDYLDEMILEN